jgi:hypothetical protein
LWRGAPGCWRTTEEGVAWRRGGRQRQIWLRTAGDNWWRTTKEGGSRRWLVEDGQRRLVENDRQRLLKS